MTRICVLRLGPHVSLPIGRRFLCVAPVLFLTVMISAYFSLSLGYTATSVADVWAALSHPTEEMSTAAQMIADFRMPRTATALIAGSMMAASGYLLQVVSRNGLADPGLLGLSDGASVAVLVSGMALTTVSPIALSAIALAGSLSSSILVVGLGRRVLTGGGIILVGLAISIFLGSVVEIILVSGDAMQFSRLMRWSRGTLDAVAIGDLRLIFYWWIILLPLVLLGSGKMGPLLLGDEVARSLGLATRPVVAGFILLAAAFAAPVVATCGPVAFLGLMSSYIARSLVGDRPTEVLITAMFAGSIILLWADTAGRTFFGPVQVSAGIMISIVGVLVFLLIARAAQNRH